jgi:DnaK suppressor protein
LLGIAASTDQFENSVVSKVSEVMTKTNKSTPAANQDIPLISEEQIRAMSDDDYMNPHNWHSSRHVCNSWKKSC